MANMKISHFQIQDLNLDLNDHFVVTILQDQSKTTYPLSRQEPTIKIFPSIPNRNSFNFPKKANLIKLKVKRMSSK